MYRLTFRRADHVFFQNNDDHNAFVENRFVLREKSSRLPGSGVDLTRFTLNTEIDNDEIQASSDAPIFLFVGRVLWDKGVGEFVEASRLVKTKYPRARFRILGSTGAANPSAVSEEELHGWIAAGDIEYAGSAEDVRLEMARADCVVLPSYREGVPRSLLEAAALARPVVTTDAPGCRDTIVDGSTGYLCKVRDSQDLASKILQFIALENDERKRMGQKARQFIEAHFDERFVLRKYLEIVSLFDTRKADLVESEEEVVTQ
jgi:glycosyltransferase involved in cell wall biosynthesis